MKNIDSPKIGTVVTHTGQRMEDNQDYPCDVLITSGQYLSGGRVSNFWYWKRVLPDGKLSEMEHGYGSFAKSSNQYNIEISVIIKK